MSDRAAEASDSRQGPPRRGDGGRRRWELGAAAPSRPGPGRRRVGDRRGVGHAGLKPGRVGLRARPREEAVKPRWLVAVWPVFMFFHAGTPALMAV